MFTRVALLSLLFPIAATADDRKLTVVPSRSLPTIEAAMVYPAGAVKPGKERPKPVLVVTKLGEPAALPGEGPFDVYVRPKGGLEVRVAAGLTGKPGPAHELQLGGLLGTVEVFGDKLPRADRVVLTAPDDPGPSEKGHTAIQSAADYRVELVVPEGFYAVWVVPANGARAVQAADRVRVHASRSTRVGE